MITLGSKEKEVFDLLINGLSPSEIATKLRRDNRTISTHISRIKEKFNFEGSTHKLVVWWFQGKLPTIEEQKNG